MAPGHSFSEDEEDDPLTCASGVTLEGGATGTTPGAGISRAEGKPLRGSGSRPREGPSTRRSGSTDFAFPPPSPAGSLEECLLSPSIQGSTATPSADSRESSTASTGVSFPEGLRDTPDMVDTRGLSAATSSVGFPKGSTAGGNESRPDPFVRCSLRAIVLMASGRSFSDDEEEEDNQEEEEAKAGGNEKYSAPCPSVVTPADGNATTTGERSKLATSATPDMIKESGTGLTSPLLISTSRIDSTLTKWKSVEKTVSEQVVG